MKFFVARVDVDRVRFESGRTVLSPLRVHYESEQLSLPVRLGLLNSSGTQDLVVQILARNQRYEVANYPNAFIPTNLDVADDVRERFGDFYGALLDRTMERNPGAVVTEYAWQATTCDPCPPDTVIDAQALTTLGGDVLYAEGVQSGGGGWGGSWGRTVPGIVPQIRLDAPGVTGPLSAEVVRRVHRRHINELRFCYEQSLAQLPTAAGTVELTAIVGASGAVSGSTATSVDGTLPPAVSTCMQNAVRRWTYPQPEGGEAVTVTQRVVVSAPSTQVPRLGPAPSQPPPGRVAYESEFVVTRLHYRYGRTGPWARTSCSAKRARWWVGASS
jgi:hypothetical protein